MTATYGALAEVATFHLSAPEDAPDADTPGCLCSDGPLPVCRGAGPRSAGTQVVPASLTRGRRAPTVAAPGSDRLGVRVRRAAALSRGPGTRTPRCSPEAPGVCAAREARSLRARRHPRRPSSFSSRGHSPRLHCFPEHGSPSEADSEGPRPEDTPKPSAGIRGIQTSCPEGCANCLMRCQPRDRG